MAKTAPAQSTGPTGLALYSRAALAGAICCSYAHVALVPLDVIKTRLQTHPEVYHGGVLRSARLMVQKEGLRALFYGLGPTATGYAIQGAAKFGLFEFFKAQFFHIAPSLKRQQFSVYLVSSMMAESIASCFLCPFEAIRIRMVSQPSYGRGMLGVGRRMISEEGVRALYRGLPPLLAKQVPYTTVQLSVFSLLMDHVYSWIGRRKEDFSVGGQLGVTVGCGVVAGVLSSIASHPADTVLSRINVALKQGQAAPKPMEIVRQLGFKRLWLGVGTRCVFTGVLSAGIFLVNDSVRLAVGMQTSGKS